MNWRARQAEYRRAHKPPADLLANVIHQTADLVGDVQPITDLYNLLVHKQRHHTVTEPDRREP